MSEQRVSASKLDKTLHREVSTWAARHGFGNTYRFPLRLTRDFSHGRHQLFLRVYDGFVRAAMLDLEIRVESIEQDDNLDREYLGTLEKETSPTISVQKDHLEGSTIPIGIPLTSFGEVPVVSETLCDFYEQRGAAWFERFSDLETLLELMLRPQEDREVRFFCGFKDQRYRKALILAKLLGWNEDDWRALVSQFRQDLERNKSAQGLFLQNSFTAFLEHRGWVS